MIKKDTSMTVFIAILIVGLAVGIGGVILSDKDDSFLEESGEILIEYATKEDVDLTPNSPEK